MSLDNRYLAEDGGVGGSGGGGDTQSDGQASVVISNALRLYGTIFVVFFCAFCVARKRYPLVYSPRSWVKSMHTRLAEEHHGYLGWMRYVWKIPDEQLLNECGMDALCYIRLLKFGMRVSIFGALLSLVLMPIYYTAPTSKKTAYIRDPFSMVTISSLPDASSRFFVTVVACYLLYGFVMYNFFKEIEWFIINRRRFLTRPLPRNYTVFIRYIPMEYRSADKLLTLYQHIYSEEKVLEARINIKAPRLQKKVAARNKVLAKLEEAIALRNLDGGEPTHTTALIGGDRVNSIEVYTKLLDELNQEISNLIDQAVDHERIGSRMNDPVTNGAATGDYGSISHGGNDSVPSKRAFHPSHPAGNHFDATTAVTPTDGDSTAQNIKDYLAAPVQAVGALAQAAKETIINGEEGEALGSGFVTFKSLQCVHSTLQDIQHRTPFSMQVLEAPEVDDVFWKNMGITHKQVEYGKILSFVLTILLFLNWTVITSGIQSLSSVEQLRQIPAVGKYLNKFFEHIPWAEAAMRQLAPLLLVVANMLLRMVLTRLSMFEGPISGAHVRTNLFVKLAVFAIVQTFFVSAISGSLLDVLFEVIDNPPSIIGLLANSLPSKSTFFIQLALVNCLLRMGIEVLRVFPIVMGWIRKCSGLERENVEQERGTPHWNLRAFANDSYFDHGEAYSYLILYFLTLKVYAVIAPVVTFFLGGCFFLMILIYRHQFIYVYPARPDSGGKVWVSFMQILPYCLLLGELTIFGLLGTKYAFRAASLLTPLIAITVYFVYYINQRHYQRAEHLSALDCMLADAENRDLDFDFARGKYIQPEFRIKVARPYHEENVCNSEPVAA